LCKRERGHLRENGWNWVKKDKKNRLERMHGLGINGEGKSRGEGQPSNPGSP